MSRQRDLPEYYLESGIRENPQRTVVDAIGTGKKYCQTVESIPGGQGIFKVVHVLPLPIMTEQPVWPDSKTIYFSNMTGVHKTNNPKETSCGCCQVIYSQFGLAIHQNDHQARRRFVEWAQNEITVVPDFHKRILFSDEAHFWLNDYVNKQNCRIWSEANPQVYVETPLHPEKLTVWCALWAGGIILQKR
ncbi:uncharacterized protein TNCV_1830441 [Trichonephila clavipes]|nr:uncharacterized protein TNCV_1830441 [Trichonephila clavipes]